MKKLKLNVKYIIVFFCICICINEVFIKEMSDIKKRARFVKYIVVKVIPNNFGVFDHKSETEKQLEKLGDKLARYIEKDKKINSEIAVMLAERSYNLGSDDLRAEMFFMATIDEVALNKMYDKRIEKAFRQVYKQKNSEKWRK